MRKKQLIFILTFTFLSLTVAVCISAGGKSLTTFLFPLLSLYCFIPAGIYEISRWKAKENDIIRHMLGICSVIFLISVFIQIFVNRSRQFSLFFITAVTVTALAVYIYRKIKSVPRKKSYPAGIEIPDLKFRGFNAEELFPEAVSKLCSTIGIAADSEIYDDMIADRREDLLKGCSVYFSYMFAWLVNHDAIKSSESFGTEADNIRICAADPSEVLYRCCGGKLSPDAVEDDYLQFLDYYYEEWKLRNACYKSDYEELVCNGSPVTYTGLFSWNTYRAFSELLDRRYRNYLIERPLLTIDYDEWLCGEDYSEVFCQNFEICLQPVSAEEKDEFLRYAEECVLHFKNTGDEMLEKIVRSINQAGYNITKESMIKETSAFTIIIFRPFGTEPAYVIGFEADFEPEHGISVVIRGSEVRETGYRSDYTSPWKEERGINE